LSVTFILLLAFSCGKNKNELINFDDQRAVKNIAKQLIDENIDFISSGYFTSDTAKSIVAGLESSDKNHWGISFSLIEKVDDEFQVVYNTGMLEGSFDKCIVDKMKFSSNKKEMIYYNSQDFYLGTAGGDVFSYLINLAKKEIYYAHLIVQKSAGVSLFLSENIDETMMRKFFIGYFKKDFGPLRIIKTDVL
jgi:hypothetical protein